MILFTGTGQIAETYAKYFPCKIVSARFLNDTELEDVISSSDIIIHNSACLKAKNLSEYLKSNFILTKRILDITYKVNSKAKFINIS